MADLKKADADVVDGQLRVTEQMIRVECWRLPGHDTNQAEELLRTLEATLAGWNAHRLAILDRIAVLDAIGNF